MNSSFYPSFLQMLSDMATFADKDYSPDHIDCKPLEDIPAGRIGFRITVYPDEVDERYTETKEFWTHLGDDCVVSPWRDVLRTPQGRDWVATTDPFGYYLWRCKDPKEGRNNFKPWSDNLLKC
jgi:hypothetical protein